MANDPAPPRKRPWLRRRPVREREMTLKQIIITGLTLIAAGVAFWVAVAVFPEVDWTSLRRVAFAGAILPVVGVVLLGIALVKVIRSRVAARGERR